MLFPLIHKTFHTRKPYFSTLQNSIFILHNLNDLPEHPRRFSVFPLDTDSAPMTLPGPWEDGAGMQGRVPLVTGRPHFHRSASGCRCLSPEGDHSGYQPPDEHCPQHPPAGRKTAHHGGVKNGRKEGLLRQVRLGVLKKQPPQTGVRGKQWNKLENI